LHLFNLYSRNRDNAFVHTLDTTNSMKNKQISIFLSVAILLLGCNQDSIYTDTNKFSGLWELHIIEELDSITGIWSKSEDRVRQGYLMYDEKDNMSVHLTNKGYQNTELRFQNFVDTIPLEALKHLTKSMVYFAKYTVDKEKNVIEHARISHSNPRQWNEVVTRKYTFDGDTLTLEPMEERNMGVRLRWVKQSVSNNK